MLVQYVIDWEYIRAEINSARSDDGREIIRRCLRSLRKGIEANGVLFLDKGNRGIRELVAAQKDLQQDDINEPIAVWKKLSDELEAIRKCYSEKGILISLNDSADGILGNIILSRERFLQNANLSQHYDFPCAVITRTIQPAEHGVQYVDLYSYDDSLIEQRREEWMHTSFGNGDDNEADTFWAALSVGASRFGEAVIWDPYCLSFLFCNNPQYDHSWEDSLKKILSFFVRNKFVKKVVLVGRESTLVRRNIDFTSINRIVSGLINRNVHRDSDVICGIRIKRTGTDWHDRYIDIGVTRCMLPRGLDVYKNTRIAKPFEVLVMTDRRNRQFGEACRLGIHTYTDLKNVYNNGLCVVDLGDIQQIEDIKPSDDKDTCELKFRPPIQIRLGR